MHDVIKFVTKDPKAWYDRTAYPYPSKNFLELPGMEEARRASYVDVFIHDLSNGRFVQRSPQISRSTKPSTGRWSAWSLRDEDPKASLDQACMEIERALAER